MSIVQGTIINGTDVGIGHVRDLLVGTTQFTLISDTGADITHVVFLKYKTSMHYLKILYSSGAIKFEVWNLANSAVLAGFTKTITATNPTYKLLVNGDTVAMTFNSDPCFIATALGSAFVIGVANTIRWASSADDFTVRTCCNTVPGVKTAAGKQFIYPLIMFDGTGVSVEESHPTNVFAFPNVDSLVTGTIVTIAGSDYLTFPSEGGAVKALVKGT